jgi:two-component system, NtrC family, sensor kinase
MPIKKWTLFRNVWPRFFFHKHNAHLDSFYTFSNYRRIWVICICILAFSSLLPLVLATAIHYKLIQHSVDSELMLRAERLTSNAKRSVAFFIDERLDALTFTIKEMGYENLRDNHKLKEVFYNLKFGFGGFTDLSVIDGDGSQVAYTGPFNLEGKNYINQPWFAQSLKTANYVSDVFTGYRDAPHIIIAVRSETPDGLRYILRATLDIERLMQMLLSYKTGRYTDIFLINHKGVLQTPSINFGNIFNKTPLVIPEFSNRTNAQRISGNGNGEKTIIMGYSYISTDMVATPFILLVLKKKEEVMRTWLNVGRTFNWMIGISGVFIIMIITLLSTFMVNKLYMADKTKAQTMLQMEQSQQLACIGQLAAGVAHEINNPLALINETAGYVKDLYSFASEKISETEVIEYIESIIEAVERCGAITSQLLGFVRQFDIKIRKINLVEMVGNVLDFYKKEAEYRSILLSTSLPELPLFIETDSGKLQQILVNLVNNAFQAVEEGGHLDIIVSLTTPELVEIAIKDTGCGISSENLNKIHEPFFSTKKEKMGTGLGLSITYGLVKKLQGNINVESTQGVGTIFTITLPVRIQEGDLA